MLRRFQYQPDGCVDPVYHAQIVQLGDGIDLGPYLRKNFSLRLQVGIGSRMAMSVRLGFSASSDKLETLIRTPARSTCENRQNVFHAK